MTNDLLKVGALLIIAILVGIFYPLAVIWALNTLFSFGLGYTFWNWLAVVVLHVFFQGNAIVTNNK